MFLVKAYLSFMIFLKKFIRLVCVISLDIIRKIDYNLVISGRFVRCEIWMYYYSYFLITYLGNVSKACKVMGYSRDSFYRFK